VAFRKVEPSCGAAAAGGPSTVMDVQRGGESDTFFDATGCVGSNLGSSDAGTSDVERLYEVVKKY
jgi:hypothetical protein